MARKPVSQTPPDSPPDSHPGPQPVDRAAIEERVGRLRAEVGELGAMMRDDGQQRLHEARVNGPLHDPALIELQRQLEALEAEVSHRVRAKPVQSLGLAALAGLIVGLILRR